MQAQFTTEKLIEIFCECDDFCQFFTYWLEQNHPDKRPIFRGGLTISEIITILINYHLSGHKCFEYYYKKMILNELQSYFPLAPSYKHFLSKIPKVMDYVYMFQQFVAFRSELTGLYIIDSKKLPVCDNRRIKSHQVFQGLAQSGKTSTGWFYGFKIHLVINHLGQIVRAVATPGNVADNEKNLLRKLLGGLKGQCLGDKGYLTKLFQEFYSQGLYLITKAKKNMKPKPMLLKDRLLLKKRGLIEAVNDILMTVCDIDHTRHRSPINAMVNLFSGLTAYAYIEKLPEKILKNLLTH